MRGYVYNYRYQGNYILLRYTYEACKSAFRRRLHYFAVTHEKNFNSAHCRFCDW